MLLPSWADDGASATIMQFVRQVTTPSSSSYVPAEDRVAVLDSDGTLWCERPARTLAFFVMYRLREVRADSTILNVFEPGLVRAARAGDYGPFQALDLSSLSEIVLQLEEGCTPEEFIFRAHRFLRSTVHPRFGMPFAQLTYRPMIELLRLLEAKEFRTFVVTGGSLEFVRAASEGLYGIPRERVAGPAVDYTCERRDGKICVIRTRSLCGTACEGEAKVHVIQQYIGRRPILAVGNSVDDREMLEYAHSGTQPSLCLLLQHDDPIREYEYDVGQEFVASAALHISSIVSMRHDFRHIFRKHPRSKQLALRMASARSPGFRHTARC
jgi:phosphoserine phosphatase